MPEETRYITVSGAVPNAGFPAGVMFAAVVGSPPAPNTAHCEPPPAYTPPLQAFHPTQHPGQYGDGSMLLGDFTHIHWLNGGDRPCDAPYGYSPEEFKFKMWKVASVMRVRDLMEYLEAPPGDNYGITQMEGRGNDTWVAVMTITRGSEMADRTLAEVGWTQWNSQGAPIWLCMKKPRQ